MIAIIFFYVSGLTESNNFANQIGTAKGAEDIFVTKMDSGGTAYWTYVFGGEGDDRGRAILAHPDGDIYIYGVTFSQNLDGRVNTFYGGTADAFLARVFSNGELCWSRYLGGIGEDGGWALRYLKKSSEFLMVGRTTSTNLPNATNVFGGGEADGYVMRTDKNGEVIWSTFMGGIDWDDLFGVSLINDDGEAIVCRDFASRNLPARINDYTGSDSGGWDALLARVGSQGQIDWSMYLGGTDFEYAWSVLYDGQKHIFVSGSTASMDFCGAANNYYGGQVDAWLGRVNIDDLNRVVMHLYGQCPGKFQIKVTNCTPY